jgi:general nucleoside transport system permease protein
MLNSDRFKEVRLNLSPRWIGIGTQILAVFLALVFTSTILLLTGTNPLEAYRQILLGSFGSASRFSDVFVAWVPLLLATTGLLVTFAAGLWNIGIEGQIILGAIFTTGTMRLLQDSGMNPAIIITLSIMAGMIGGALWAGLAGALKTFGGVNEIFGGLGLNFVATALTIWLIFGPWKRPGVGSMSGTQPFPEELWLPTLSTFRVSPWAVALGFISIVIIFVLLQGTQFGLKLKAVGKNMRGAFLLGVPTWQYMMLAFFVCGGLAGLAGAMQVTAVYHRLIPAISSGYGFMGLMVAMLVNFSPILAVFVAFFFVSLNIGSIQLPIVMKLDSSLSGVLQGALVLFVLMVNGARQRLIKRS